MKKIEIIINKETVMTEVKKQSEYLAAASDDYDKIRITDSNKEILERYWREGCDDLEKAIASWLMYPTGQAVSTDYQDTDYTLIFSAARFMDDNVVGTLSNSITSYLVEYILSRWYIDHASADSTKDTAVRSAMKLSTVVRILNNDRRRPLPEDFI